MVVLRKGLDEEAFTLVELLVVITIIGILSTVTIVSYRGVKERANNARITAIVSSYVEMFQLYKSNKGEYPYANYSENAVCLGNPDDYPASGVYRDGWCATWTVDDATAYHSTRANFNEMLDDITKDLPSGAVDDVYTTTIPNPYWSNPTEAHYRGILYKIDYEGTSSIHYFLNGTQDCTVGESYHYGGITECVVELGGSAVGDDWGGNGGEGYFYYE